MISEISEKTELLKTLDKLLSNHHVVMSSDRVKLITKVIDGLLNSFIKE